MAFFVVPVWVGWSGCIWVGGFVIFPCGDVLGVLVCDCRVDVNSSQAVGSHLGSLVSSLFLELSKNCKKSGVFLKNC